MEAQTEGPTSSTVDQINPDREEVEGAWVSPDVAAAQAGERIEFGKQFDEDLSEPKE